MDAFVLLRLMMAGGMMYGPSPNSRFNNINTTVISRITPQLSSAGTDPRRTGLTGQKPKKNLKIPIITSLASSELLSLLSADRSTTCDAMRESGDSSPFSFPSGVVD